MRKYLIAVCAIVMISGICGFLAKKSFTDAGILSMRTAEEAENIPFHFYAILEESDSSGFVNYEDSYVEDFEETECIAVVAPTGQIVQNGGMLSQMEEGKDICYIGIKNLMQKGDRYLAFFHDVKLNEELGMEYYQLEGSIFNYLNLDDTNEDGMVDMEQEYRLKDVKGYEFFTSSKNVLKGMNKIKKHIIERYAGVETEG